MDRKQRESTVQQPGLNLPPYHCFTRGKHTPENSPTGFSPPKTHICICDHRRSETQGSPQGGRKEKKHKEKATRARKASQYKEETLQHGKNMQDFF